MMDKVRCLLTSCTVSPFGRTAILRGQKYYSSKTLETKDPNNITKREDASSPNKRVILSSGNTESSKEKQKSIYKVPEYYAHNPFSYVDYDVTMVKARIPQPSSIAKK